MVARPAQTRQIYAYFTAFLLLITVATPAGALVDIATSFMLKNRLHAGADVVASYRFVIGLPLYFAFVFGLIRDRWSPFGLHDRGQLLLFAPLTSLVFLALAFSELNATTLTVGILVAILCFRMVTASYDGLLSLIGQEKLMSGRLSTLWNIGATVPLILTLYASGWVTEHLGPRAIFLLMAAFGLLLGLFGLWNPRAVFDRTYDKPQAQHASFWSDLKRLVRHRPIYAAMAIYFLWNFAPAGGTALQYYMTNELHLSDASFANFSANFNIAGIPAFLLYGFLCRRVAQKKLLIWATLIAIPQWIPILLVGSPGLAVWTAFPIGLMGGLASAAYVDLNVRACPKGLQGSLMMLAAGLYTLSGRGSDVIGTKIMSLDKAHGFMYCAIATSAVYALMFPLLFLIPKELIATRDGEAAAA